MPTGDRIKKVFSYEERRAIVQALELAAQQFQRDAEHVQILNGTQRIVEQFEKQRSVAINLAAAIDDSRLALLYS